MLLLNDLYTIEEVLQLENSIRYTLHLNPDHIVYLGHFPGQAVTPGVVQLQIIQELLEKGLGKKLELVSIKSTKFTSLINPNKISIIKVSISYSIDEGLVSAKASIASEDSQHMNYRSLFAFRNS